MDTVDRVRRDVSASLTEERRAEFGQFLTPAPVAALMASLLRVESDHLRILEPGAGVGSLIVPTIESIVRRARKPSRVSVTAYEIDPILASRLPEALDHCRSVCAAADIQFDAEMIKEDFIPHAVDQLRGGLFGTSKPPRYDMVVTNPPYRKINTSSSHRQKLAEAGVQVTNLYAGFIGLSVQLLADGGEIVAITPRSFCNGVYFRPFRELLLRTVAFQHIHLFESRKEAFKDDDVLQENIIWRAVKGCGQQDVEVSVSEGDRMVVDSSRRILHSQFIWPRDPQKIIHIVPDAAAQLVTDSMRSLPCRLHDLNIRVSTGRVVEFRAKSHLRSEPVHGSVPLIYPAHFHEGFVQWPINGRKPNALALDTYTQDQVVPNETYVLLKRFTSKEERRRIVAVVYDPTRSPSLQPHDCVGIENHVNYIHRNGRGLPLLFARGLAVYLNSSLVDQFFRQFSGHTQVNAGDLGMFHFPTEGQLERLGIEFADLSPSQNEIDNYLQQHIVNGQAPEGSSAYPCAS